MTEVVESLCNLALVFARVLTNDYVIKAIMALVVVVQFHFIFHVMSYGKRVRILSDTKFLIYAIWGFLTVIGAVVCWRLRFQELCFSAIGMFLICFVLVPFYARGFIITSRNQWSVKKLVFDTLFKADVALSSYSHVLVPKSALSEDGTVSTKSLSTDSYANEDMTMVSVPLCVISDVSNLTLDDKLQRVRAWDSDWGTGDFKSMCRKRKVRYLDWVE